MIPLGINTSLVYSSSLKAVVPANVCSNGGMSNSFSLRIIPILAIDPS